VKTYEGGLSRSRITCCAVQSQCQSYFTSGGLPPISSSWRQAPRDSRPAIFFQLNPCRHSPYVTYYLTRGWVRRLRLLLVPASAVILGSESYGTHDHILMSHDLILPQPGRPGPRIYIPQEEGGPVIPPCTGFHFRLLLRLVGLRWRYLDPPIHGLCSTDCVCRRIYPAPSSNRTAVKRLRVCSVEV
jgi:hypothetical protein